MRRLDRSSWCRRDIVVKPLLVYLEVQWIALCLQLRHDGCRVYLASHIWHDIVCLDFFALARQIGAQLGHIAALEIVGRRDALLLDKDVRAGRAALEDSEDIRCDAGRGVDGSVVRVYVQPATD